jgi:hypothetical protein
MSEVCAVKPEFMGEPCVYNIKNASQPVHEYSMPESGKEIIEAVNWMMTQYDGVECEYGATHGTPYCNLTGTVKEWVTGEIYEQSRRPS